VNPDAHGRASPVVVRVYELTSPAIFNTADFFSLYERDRETLGPELVAVEELQLVPGEKRALDRTLQPTTRHLAVTAAFRQIERAQWRATMPVPLNKTTAVTVRLDGVTVSITAAP
jgi:type VI secretion system protein VasD